MLTRSCCCIVTNFAREQIRGMLDCTRIYSKKAVNVLARNKDQYIMYNRPSSLDMEPKFHTFLMDNHCVI